ncbi:unnamed protein product [Umbelopsis sp. WA50703]
MSLSSRNYDTYGRNGSQNINYSYRNNGDLADLRKSIREQEILLSALHDSTSSSSAGDGIESLKRRIANVDKQIHEKNLRPNSVKPDLILGRYSSRMRQLSDLADHQRSMQKEIDFTLNTTIKNLEKKIEKETERLYEKERELARIRDVKATGGASPSLANPTMSEADRIRSKAQAMIAARLNKTNYIENIGSEAKKTELGIEERESHWKRQLSQTDSLQQAVKHVLNASSIDESDIEQNEKRLKEQRMFEDGLFVAEELSDFIESLRRDRANKAALGQPSAATSRYGPPPATPPLPKKYSAGPPPLPAPVYSRHAPSSKSLAPPPPVPTSLRPQTPRSAEAIKAEAHRKTEEKRMSMRINGDLSNFQKIGGAIDKEQVSLEREETSSEEKYKLQQQEAEKAAQAKLREASRQAELRLSEFNQRKKDAEASKQAAQEEERKRNQEAEQAALKKEEERLEQERLQLEKENKAAEEQRVIQARLEKERQRIEEEKQELERQEREARERQQKLEEETKAAELAKEQEAERLRKAQEDLERAKKAEAEQKLAAEQAEREQRRLLELEKQRIQAAEEEERKKREAEEEERINKQTEVQEEGIWSTDLNNEARRTRNSRDFRHAPEFPTSFSFTSSQQEETDTEWESASESDQEEPTALDQETTTTAGTAGFGTDLDDEVDFSTTFKVRSLYEFKGVRDDDLSFEEKQIVNVQPFQDEDSEWWFGTSESTKEAGYFPRTYVEVVKEATPLDRRESDDIPNIIVHQPKAQHSIPMLDDQRAPVNLTTSLSTPTSKTLGRSAPTSPIIQSASPLRKIGRRRASSNASVLVSSPISTSARSSSPVVLRPDSPNVLNTWASNMDEKELLNVSPEERKRQEAIYELVVTEKTYLNDLQLIVNVFYADSSQYLSPDAQNVIFSNVEDLLLCNTAILSDLEDRQREGANFVGAVGDIFLTHAENLKCYQTYCRNQAAASRFLQKKRDEDKLFAAFLKSCQSRPECRSLDLSSFLLEPMQRITRYPLLLRQILQSTPKYHHDYGMVAEAIEKAEQVLQDVNEAARRHENKQKLQELSRLVDLEGLETIDRVGREFVMEGTLYKAKSGRKLHGCLFNDMLILAQPIRGLSSQGYLYTLYKEPMPTDRIQVRGSSKAGLDDTVFQIVYGDSVISVKAATTSMKKQWMTRISQANSVLSGPNQWR